MKNNGGFAFPHANAYATSMNGMSLRDWFAGQALSVVMKTLWDNAADFKLAGDNEMFFVASQKAYAIADAMLKEREKQ